MYIIVKRKSTWGDFYAIQQNGGQSIKALSLMIIEIFTEFASKSNDNNTSVLKERIGEALKDDNVRRDALRLRNEWPALTVREYTHRLIEFESSIYESVRVRETNVTSNKPDEMSEIKESLRHKIEMTTILTKKVEKLYSQVDVSRNIERRPGRDEPRNCFRFGGVSNYA